LRQMALGQSSSAQATAVTYMVQKGQIAFFLPSTSASLFGAVGAVFNAALLAPPATKASPRDIWANVKIPMVEKYENSLTADADGWYTTNAADTVYASLIGIPIAGMEDAGAIDSAANIEAQYLHLECPVVGWQGNPLYGHEPPYVNSSGPGAVMYTWDNTTARMAMNPVDLTPLNFTYHDWGATGSSQCLVTTTYVEAEVLCGTSITCATTKVRRSKLKHPPAAYTMLEDVTYKASNYETFTDNFVRAMFGHTAMPTAVQGHLVNPDYSALANFTLQILPNETYAIRLGQLMNTYWECMVAMYAIPGGVNEKTATMTGNASDAVVHNLANSAQTNGTKIIVKKSSRLTVLGS
jgi:hypothetical protein